MGIVGLIRVHRSIEQGMFICVEKLRKVSKPFIFASCVWYTFFYHKRLQFSPKRLSGHSLFDVRSRAPSAGVLLSSPL